MKNLLFSILLLFILYSLMILGFYIYQIYEVNPNGFLFENNWKNEIIKPIIFSTFTIVGIFSRVIYNIIDNSKVKRIKILNILKKTFESKDFWLAFLISPIIIVLFYEVLNEIESLALLSLVSYQNGFFFKTIFENVESSYE